MSVSAVREVDSERARAIAEMVQWCLPAQECKAEDASCDGDRILLSALRKAVFAHGLKGCLLLEILRPVLSASHAAGL